MKYIVGVIVDTGHGAFGEVLKCRCKFDDIDCPKGEEPRYKKGDFVAIKVVLDIFKAQLNAKRLLRELRFLRGLRGHESIVELLDILPPKLDNINSFNNLYVFILYFVISYIFFYVHI